MEDVTRAEVLVRLVGPWLVHIVEACAVLTILYGVVRAFLASLWWVVRDMDTVPLTQIRVSLGRALSLALEFLLAADILQTMLSPTLDQVGMLAAIAVIRTLLNYFLAKEIEQETRELSHGSETQARRPIPATTGQGD
jgi:uncharacterized membrane protein